MKKIVFLAYNSCMSSAISGLVDAFAIANSWSLQKLRAQTVKGLQTDPLFEMEIASLHGGTIHANGGMQIPTDKKIDEVQDADVVLIPPHMCGFNPDEEEQTELLPWLQELYRNNVRIGAICTGVAILARTGLLNGRIATTNWQVVRSFRKRFPLVQLKPERILTEDCGLICTGAITAQYNLALHLISLFGSEDLARDCAKVFLVDPNRSTQAPYMITTFRKSHGDASILKAQTWIEENYSKAFSTDDVANLVGISPRHFKRRFKSATGENPLKYTQQVRLEIAKSQLESTQDNIDEITQRVGYSDTRTFRRLFKSYTSLSPREYREKFSVTNY